MRDLLNIINKLTEAAENATNIKKVIIDMIKTTEEGTVLNQVLKVLEAGNIGDRIAQVVGTDADAKGFIKQISDTIIQSDASIEQKNAFLERFPKGILDVGVLLNGKNNTFDDLVGPGFPAELLSELSVRLTSQGVGPGEVALAIMSPKVKWSGREAGGGDVLVNGRPVEVKTRVSSGGRWLNPRKANMNLPAIKKIIEQKSQIDVPDRLNVNDWVNVYRPNIDKKDLPEVVKTIADGIFNATNNKAYQDMLTRGDVSDIVDEQLRTGYENYKKLSGFEGILMMDLPTKTAQYFKNYDDMDGAIKSDATYIFAPEGEMMPKVSLISGSGSSSKGGKTTAAPDQSKRTPNLAAAAADIVGDRSDKVAEPIRAKRAK
jgi:DNA-binding ferritin-like protein (Dps family)